MYKSVLGKINKLHKKNNQSYEVKQGEQGRVEHSSCKPQKAN
jgi:hypothetical protein